MTLSLGERPDEDLARWRAAGADRYLLRFETSDAELYRRIHPPLAAPSDRIAILRRLGELGYEVGSGVMIGIPGQTYESLAEDIELFRTLDLDMIGVGPYLPHPDTPLGAEPGDFRAPESDQVPNTEEMTYKVLALTRLACPRANIPSTTALATLNTDGGRELGPAARRQRRHAEPDAGRSTARSTRFIPARPASPRRRKRARPACGRGFFPSGGKSGPDRAVR